jgi:hypothetical protein
MFWYPVINEKFYIKSNENKYVPATRLENPDQTKMTIYLENEHEHGEILQIDFNQFPFDDVYFHPDDEEDTSSDPTIKCKLRKLSVPTYNYSEIQIKEFLKNNLNVKFTFFVKVKIDEKTFLVDISPYDNDNYDDQQSLSNHDSIDDDHIEFNENESIAVNATMNSMEIELDDEPNPDLEIQYFGFKTKDELGICPFEIDGGCFKGGRCKLKHYKKAEDCGDKDETFSFHIYEHLLPHFKLNSWIPIKITQFLSVNRFYCQLQGDQYGLIELIDEMNDGRSYRKFDEVPHHDQLVIIKSQNGKFYRARVDLTQTMNVDEDDSELLTVVLLDLGTIEKVSLSNVYKWNGIQDKYHSFQMEIANIYPTESQEKSNEAIKVIMKMKYNLEARIVDNSVRSLKCILFNSETGDDIGLDLVEQKLVKKQSLFLCSMYNYQSKIDS